MRAGFLRGTTLSPAAQAAQLAAIASALATDAELAAAVAAAVAGLTPTNAALDVRYPLLMERQNSCLTNTTTALRGTIAGVELSIPIGHKAFIYRLAFYTPSTLPPAGQSHTIQLLVDGASVAAAFGAATITSANAAGVVGPSGATPYVIDATSAAKRLGAQNVASLTAGTAAIGLGVYGYISPSP